MRSETETRPYSLRKFVENDLEKVLDINSKCLPENYTSSFFMQLYKSHPETFLVAETRQVLIGYIMCRVETSFSEINRFRLAKKGHVVSVAVLPEHRRNGIGVALMLRAVKAMEAYGCSESYLEVRVSNNSAIAMYEKLGYRILKRIAGYYFDGEEACVLARKIPIDLEQTKFFDTSKFS